MPYKYKKERQTERNWDISDVDTPFVPLRRRRCCSYAEAQNELGNTGTAVTYLNLIRGTRAEREPAPKNRPEPADYGRRDRSTVRPRRDLHGSVAWEFAFEGKSAGSIWCAATRESPATGPRASKTHDPNATNQGPLASYKKRFPIPQGQISSNPALCQKTPATAGRPAVAGVQP